MNHQESLFQIKIFTVLLKKKTSPTSKMALVTVHLDRQEVPLLMAHLCGCKVPLASMPLWMQKCTVGLLQVDLHCLQANHLNGSLLGGQKVFRHLVQWHHRLAFHLKAPRLPVSSLPLPPQQVLAILPPHKREVANIVACSVCLKVSQVSIVLGHLDIPSLLPHP